jgi:L-cysteine desulfidase
MFGDARKGLVIFDSVGDECLKNAKKLTKLVDVKIRELAKNPDLYAEAKVEARGTWGRAIIQHMHDNVVLVESGGRNYFKGGVSREGSTEEQKKRFRNLTLNDLIGYVADLPEAVVAIVRKGMELVKRLSDEGLEKPRGIGVGYALKGSETRAWVKARTAAACDSRMFGSSNPSMAVAGSGNQGIAATAPIYAYAEKNRVDEDLLLRSVALSYLITIYATYHSSYLSAMCGCATKAGMGSTAGLAYYSSEGDDKVVKMAIQNFIAGVPGILCDGGKYSCALKLATVSDAVYQSVLLAMKNRAPRYTDGILGKNTEESIRNLGEVLRAAEPINKTIVELLSGKLE